MRRPFSGLNSDDNNVVFVLCLEEVPRPNRIDFLSWLKEAIFTGS